MKAPAPAALPADVLPSATPEPRRALAAKRKPRTAREDTAARDDSVMAPDATHGSTVSHDADTQPHATDSSAESLTLAAADESAVTIAAGMPAVSPADVNGNFDDGVSANAGQETSSSAPTSWLPDMSAWKPDFSGWFKGASDMFEDVSPLMVAGVAAAGVGGVLIAKNVKDNNDDTHATVPVTVMAGPLAEAVKVEAFDKDGKLVASGTTDATGKVELALPTDYKGTLLLKATALDADGISYVDEATGQTAVHLGSLRALIESVDGGPISITPLTELVVRKTGVTSDASVDAATIASVNQKVALLLGLGDTSGKVTNILDAAYNEADGIDDAERRGQVLAILSGADGATGSADATLSKLSTAIDLGTTTMSAAGLDLLTTGRALFASGADASRATLLPPGLPVAPSASNTAAAASVFASGALADGKLDATEAASDFSMPVALPANVIVGDTLTVTLTPANPADNGTVQTSTHTVTRDDLSHGYALVTFTAAQLIAAGDGIKLPSMTATNASGTSAPIALGPFDLDAPPVRDVILPPPEPEDIPTPTIRFSAGYDSTLNVSDPGIKLDVRYAGLQDGDRIQVLRDGKPIGTVQRVSNQQQQAGVAVVDIPLVDLGADGYMKISVIATNTIGTANTSNALTVHLDATAPVISITPQAGMDEYVNASESALGYAVSWQNMESGDTIAFTISQAGSTPVQLGPLYTVTDNDVINGFAAISNTVAELGGEGDKVITAIATDKAGNASAAVSYTAHVDQTSPQPTLAIDTTTPAVQDRYVSTADGGITITIAYTDMKVGDVIHLVNGHGQTTPGALSNPAIGHDIPITSAGSGQMSVTLSLSDLGSDGDIDLYAVVEDAAHNLGVSNVLSIVKDTTAPDPHISMPSGADQYLNALESAFTFYVTDSGMNVGDWVQMTVNGVNKGPAYQVVQSDVDNHRAVMTLTTADFGGNIRDALVRANISDSANNTGTSGAMTVTVDQDVPNPIIEGGTGILGYMGVDSGSSLITSKVIRVAYSDMRAGDKVQLFEGGHSVSGVSTVSTNGQAYIDITLARSDIGGGADGSYVVDAVVTDAARNVGTGGSYQLTLDHVFHV